ncbi:MAG TPA: hypothetical protein VHI71_01020 [Actinomycetota bacterium]|nr:hypothetical protein [Actinomycetota bacterium]
MRVFACIGMASSLWLAACGEGTRPVASALPPDVRLVRGSGYNKSAIEHEGQTVLSFRIDVTNVGTGSGRAPAPSCFVRIGGERHDLMIFENPELAPGERGYLRTGGPIPQVSHAVFDDLDAQCAF